jgi:hypothetical protein
MWAVERRARLRPDVSIGGKVTGHVIDWRAVRANTLARVQAPRAPEDKRWCAHRTRANALQRTHGVKKCYAASAVDRAVAVTLRFRCGEAGPRKSPQ